MPILTINRPHIFILDVTGYDVWRGQERSEWVSPGPDHVSIGSEGAAAWADIHNPTEDLVLDFVAKSWKAGVRQRGETSSVSESTFSLLPGQTRRVESPAGTITDVYIVGERVAKPSDYGTKGPMGWSFPLLNMLKGRK